VLALDTMEVTKKKRSNHAIAGQEIDVMKISPMAGDIVICTRGANIGCIGVLEGSLKRNYDTQLVCFNANAYRDENSVSCSGGPAFHILTCNLKYTGIERERSFWKFKNNLARAGNSERYALSVKIWEYQAEEPHDIFQDTDVETVLSLFESNDVPPSTLDEPIGSGDGEYYLYRGDYKVFPHPFSRKPMGQYVQDTMAKKIWSAYSRFLIMSVTEHDEPVGCGYKVTSGDGYAFKDNAEFSAFVDAYSLEVRDGYWPNQKLVVPNQNVSEWRKLHWVKQ